MTTVRQHVVIVGAGVAGAAAALRIRDRLGADVDITVLEATDREGGRAARIPFAGEVVEVGGTLLHSSNELISDVMARLGLQKAARSAEAPDPSGVVGIWDGHRFRLRVPMNGWRFIAHLFVRYGIRSLRGMAAAARDATGRVTSIYPLLESTRTFATPQELTDAVGLTELTRTSLSDALATRNVSRRAIDEIGSGILRNMLNQDAGISALPGMTGLIGAGLAGGSLFSIEGGNHRVVVGSFELAAAEVRLGSRVTEVRDDRTVVLADGTTVAADIVVLAVPLAVAGIAVPSSADLPSMRYRHVHVTIVAGRPSASYFGVKQAPDVIFTTANESTPFNSLGRIGWSRAEGTPILKFFSSDALSDDLVGRLVDDVRAIERLEWDAYPVMEVAPQSAAFEITPGIFFPNALERTFSTLETESIAGHVVGDLVAERLGA